MVKGYEFAKDQYVQFTPEEIKALEEVGTHAVEISEFVPIESIDPVYFDKTYYLAPDKGAAKPYALLTEALKETKRCAVGRWATRGKAYIVMLRPIGDVLDDAAAALRRGRAAAERSRSAEDRSEARRAEAREAAHRPADRLTCSTRPRTSMRCADASRPRSRRRSKARRSPWPKHPSKASGKVIDLMEALRASLEKTEAARASTSKLGPRKAPKRVEAAGEAAAPQGRVASGNHVRGQRCNPTACGTSNESCACRAAPFAG